MHVERFLYLLVWREEDQRKIAVKMFIWTRYFFKIPCISSFRMETDIFEEYIFLQWFDKKTASFPRISGIKIIEIPAYSLIP